MGYRYTENREHWPSNDKLYQETKQTLWSEKIAKRRLSFFGHVCRLPETTPVKVALREALRPSKKPRGRPKTTYLQVIKTQLKERDIQTLEDAMIEAKDRVKWRAIVQERSFSPNHGQQ